MQPTADIPENYYLTNFLSLVEHCCSYGADLLPDHAHAKLHAFKRCPEPAQQLFVRLICRKGPAFRSDKLSYPEIPSLSTQARKLAAAELLEINPALTITELSRLLTISELRQLFSLPQGKKSDLIAQLQSDFGDEAISDQIISALPFEVWQLLDSSLIQRLTLVYFGNLHQDLSEFVLRDLGVMRYENYPLNPAHRLFKAAEQIEHLLKLQQLFRELESGAPLPDTNHIIEYLPPASVPVTPLQSRRLNELGRLLERAERTDDALNVYAHSTEPPARERQVRLLAKTVPQQALSLCQSIADAPKDITEQAFCDSFLPRLKRRLGGPPVKRVSTDYPEISLKLENCSERVEQQVLTYFASQGWQGAWCENDLLCGLFGLLCWPIIFSDQPGAFNHPFQRGPLDLNSSTFYPQRAPLFQKIFAELTESNISTVIQQRWQQKQGLQNPLVRWNRLTVELLVTAVERIPPETLIALLQQLAFDVRHYRSGLPDLFLWKQNDYQLIEVKGPGDSLQTSQKRWLKVLTKHQVPHSICHVSWVDCPPNSHSPP